MRGELWARNPSGHLVYGGGAKGGRGERGSAGATEPEAATGVNYADADADFDPTQYEYVRAPPAASAVPPPPPPAAPPPLPFDTRAFPDMAPTQRVAPRLDGVRAEPYA